MSENSSANSPIDSTVEAAPEALRLHSGAEALSSTVLHLGKAERPPSDAPLPVEVAGYEIIEELGRGGMGVVYKARQKGLNRIVALKMILAGGHAGSNELLRFRTEAETIARLHHPNIVQVYEIDEHEGRPFLSLEYCPRGTLDQHLAGKPMQPKKAAALLEILTRAIQAAHDAGVIHRDLKPANVLLKHVDVATDSHHWVPKVTDFGLAKKLDVQKGHTVSGTVMGTPSYMAPEQAAGKGNEVGPAADVYALGAVLYECLTGRPPFVGKTTLETVMQVLHQEPLPPRMLNPEIDPDLEKVTLKCLEKAPEQRYSSAADLAEDLRRYQNGEPVTARSINLFERIQRELVHSQHDVALRPWGNVLIVLGFLILLSHLASSLLLVAGWSELPSFWAPRSVLLALAVPLFMRVRKHGSFMPTNTVERLLWAVWVGYLLAFCALVWVMHVMGRGHLEVYGVASVLSGLAWFVMGGYVWGGCYLIGLLFMFAGPVLALMAGSPWSPFAFGCIWSGTLLLLGARYRKLGQAVAGQPLEA